LRYDEAMAGFRCKNILENAGFSYRYGRAAFSQVDEHDLLGSRVRKFKEERTTR
jgi:hypothetical protein